jgi:hypothetical protein
MSITSTKTQELKFHPLANLFPLMEGAEFDALVADIKANGLQEKIDLYQGKIVDGRNRYCALQQLGIDPSADAKKYFRKAIYAHAVGGGIAPHEQNNDDGVRAYIISKNIHRRHLDPETKIKILAQLVAAQPEKSDRQLAKEAGVSHPTIAKARREAEATGKALPVAKRVGADGKARARPAKKARKQPAKKAKSKTPEAPKAAASAPERETPARETPARAQQDVGPQSTGEVERLHARVDELQAEKRQLEIKIVGLESENAELKAENVELRAKLEAAGASQQRPSTNGKGKEENGAEGNDALASAGKRKAAYALPDASDPGPTPECPRGCP